MQCLSESIVSFVFVTGNSPGNFDVVIVNDNVDEAYSKLRTFILPDITKMEEEGGSGDI